MPYSNSQAYQWVLFDADETLFQFDAPRGLKLMFSRQGVDFSDADYAEYQQTNAPLWVAYQDGKISASELQLTRFSHWAKRLGRTPFELNSAFMTQWPISVSRFPVLPSCLIASRAVPAWGLSPMVLPSCSRCGCKRLALTNTLIC